MYKDSDVWGGCFMVVSVVLAVLLPVFYFAGK